MKNRLRKLSWIVLLLGIYTLLLLFLAAVESTDPDASIKGFSDALWYSIVTLSTVGYGDLYPVTLLGKWIGLLFVVLSVGTLAFLVGTAISLMTGSFLPRLRMWHRRKKHWYLFSEYNESSCALADSILKKDPLALTLFPIAQAEQATGFLCYPGTILQAAKRKKDNCHLFFISESSSNFAPALQAASVGHPVYCRSEQVPAVCPENLKLFDRYTCCARAYWNQYPLVPGQQNILLVGNGRYATALLEQGLAQNIFGPEYSTNYHLCGDWQSFQRNHPQLLHLLSGQEQDQLLFYPHWNADFDLIRRADRIVLCSDDDEENRSILHQLRKYFPTSGQLHLRTPLALEGELCFGTNTEIYSANYVIADTQSRTAKAMHEIYRRQNPDNAATWQQLNHFTRQSNLAAADHLAVKIRLLLQDHTITQITGRHAAQAYAVYCQADAAQQDRYQALEHQRWMRLHSLYNWHYGPVRDNAARVHPQMIAYTDLPPAEQKKDAYSWQLLEPLAEILEDTLEE